MCELVRAPARSWAQLACVGWHVQRQSESSDYSLHHVVCVILCVCAHAASGFEFLSGLPSDSRFDCLSACMSGSLSGPLCVCRTALYQLSVRLSACVSAYLSVGLCVCRSVSLSCLAVQLTRAGTHVLIAQKVGSIANGWEFAPGSGLTSVSAFLFLCLCVCASVHPSLCLSCLFIRLCVCLCVCLSARACVSPYAAYTRARTHSCARAARARAAQCGRDG